MKQQANAIAATMAKGNQRIAATMRIIGGKSFGGVRSHAINTAATEQ